MTLPCRRFILLAIILSVFLTGCGSTTRLYSKPIAESTYVTYPEWSPNRNVAVMPFVSVAKDKDASLKVRELFLSELYISGAFKDVVDEGEMLEVMKKLKLRETDAIGKDTMKTLGDNLGVQAIIFGVVEEYTERSAKGAQFAISLRMVDVETGSILWLGNASMEGGGSISESLGLSEGPTVIAVARDVIEDLVDDIADEIMDRKVESAKAEDVAGREAVKKDVLSSDKGKGKPAGSQQAEATPPLAVKATSAGMVATPALGGR